MKNKILTFAITAVAALGFVSCSDYLSRNPLDSNSDATNWTSESAIENYAWGFYSYLSELSYGAGWTRGQYHSEALTDDYATESFSTFTKNVPNASSAWSTPYERIRRANIMLNRIPLVEDMSTDAAKHWEGVARFFRALYHFELVKTYGDVVWVGDEVDFSKEEEITRPRDSRVVVMDNVVADLQFAAQNCYAPAKTGNAVNNMVANALLSRVALYEAAWEKYHNVSGGHPDAFYKAAKDAAAAVIASGLYTISDNYKEMYTSLDLSASKEVIMYKHYTLANVNGGKVTSAHAQYGWINSSTPTWGLSKAAVENYAFADGLPLHMQAKYDDTTLEGVFAGRDARLAATVKPTVIPVVDLPYSVNAVVSTTGYWTYKFLDDTKEDEYKAKGTWNAPSNDTDGPIFQYSEVLENYAEACAELGQISQADLDKSVNVLRTKHGKLPALTLVGTDGCSVNGKAITKDAKDPARNVLLQELRRDRRSELMADGFRHADLMRWALGKNLDTSYEDGYVGASKALIKSLAGAKWADVEQKNFWSNSGYKSQYDKANTRTWDDKYYLEPIPSGQILLDSALSQNPGW